MPVNRQHVVSGVVADCSIYTPPRRGGVRVRWRARCARATIARIVDTALAAIITIIHSGSYSYVSDLQSATTGTIVPFSIITCARVCVLFMPIQLVVEIHDTFLYFYMSVVETVLLDDADRDAKYRANYNVYAHLQFTYQLRVS